MRWLCSSVYQIQNDSYKSPPLGGLFVKVAGMKLGIERGWPQMHESGTFVRFTPTGAELFA